MTSATAVVFVEVFLACFERFVCGLCVCMCAGTHSVGVLPWDLKVLLNVCHFGLVSCSAWYLATMLDIAVRSKSIKSI